MHISFLFWNLMKHPLQKHITNIVSAHEIDVVMLAEYAINPHEIEDALNTGVTRDYRFSHQEMILANFYSFRVLVKLR
jgi:hypothetical protein